MHLGLNCCWAIAADRSALADRVAAEPRKRGGHSMAAAGLARAWLLMRHDASMLVV